MTPDRWVLVSHAMLLFKYSILNIYWQILNLLRIEKKINPFFVTEHFIFQSIFRQEVVYFEI